MGILEKIKEIEFEVGAGAAGSAGCLLDNCSCS